MNEHETSADIIADMRGGPIPQHRHDRVLLCHYADRFEAAHKREIEATAAKCCQLGRLAGYGASEIKHQQERGDCTKPVVDTKFELCNYPEQVLKIGRDFQNKDGFRGAHYDTVKLLCDTIEYQQEQLKTKTEVGNAAKLREALIKAITMLAVCEWPDGTNMEGVEELRREIDATLDVPPRNCDVGTAEEQAKRLREFCKKHRDGVRRCSRCPVERIFPKDCTLAWAQMPYEEANPKGAAK